VSVTRYTGGVSTIHFDRARERIVAVADIGSGSAGFAVLAVRSGKPASVIAAERIVLPIEERARSALIGGVADSLSHVGQRVLAASAQNVPGARPESIYCVIRTPWTHSETGRARSHFDTDISVTSALIRKLAQDAIGTISGLDRSNFLEAGVVRVELNGYGTGKPEGKHAHAITALMSDCDPAMRAAAVTALERLLPHLPMTMRSGSRALFSVLREYFREKDYFVLDMASEATTMLAVRDGAPGPQSLIPEGVRSILKRISPAGMADETLNLMRMMAREQCEDAACDALNASIARVEPELVRVFGEAMVASASPQRLPNHLVLMVQPDLAPWLTRFFSRIDFAQFTQTTQTFNVETPTPETLAAWIVPRSGVLFDCGLAVAGALVNIEG